MRKRTLPLSFVECIAVVIINIIVFIRGGPVGCDWSATDVDALLHFKASYLQLIRNVILNTHYNHHTASVDGSLWPPGSNAFSMAGQRRLDHLAAIVAEVIADDIDGHVIETGVWRGGASFLAAKTIELLNPCGNATRITYLCDSFRGIPKTKRNFELDKSAHTISILNNNSRRAVERDAKRMGLQMTSLRFVEGYFNETLPALVTKEKDIKFAVIRLDGDTYDSTMQAITVLYPRLSPGGFIIVDDYADWPGCQAAVDEYRANHGIKAPIMLVPHMVKEFVRGAYWRKERTTGEAPQPFCLGTGLDKEGRVRSLRVAGSYNPSTPVPVPLTGPPRRKFENALKGKQDLWYCQ